MDMTNEFCALSQKEEMVSGAGVVALGVGIYCGVQGL